MFLHGQVTEKVSNMKVILAITKLWRALLSFIISPQNEPKKENAKRSSHPLFGFCSGNVKTEKSFSHKSFCNESSKHLKVENAKMRRQKRSCQTASLFRESLFFESSYCLSPTSLIHHQSRSRIELCWVFYYKGNKL